jgi:hypothetical protein
MARVRTRNLRHYVFVDPKVQGALVTRAASYWLLCLVTVGLMLLCWRIAAGPSDLFFSQFRQVLVFYGPAAIASLFLLPLVVLDVIRLSNRFSGPMVRLRRAMRALARGEHVQPIEFREADFWQEFAAEFNTLAARVQGRTGLLPLENGEQEEPICLGMD